MRSDIIPLYSCSYKLIVKSKDCYVYDSEGKEYIDFESGVWCANIGHSNDRISKMVEFQANVLVHNGYRFRNLNSEQLSRELQRLIGFKNGSSLFLSSGSEAVNLAISVSQHLSGRKKILKIDNSYLSAYGYGKISNDNDYLVNVKFNDIDSIKSIDFREISAVLIETGGASVEMVQFPSFEFIKQLTDTSRENNCIVIAEEVTTGFGRLGSWFGFQNYQIVPDIVVTGKALGNGFPVSAITICSELADRFERNPFIYAQSHQNDVFGCSIGLEVIKEIEENNLISRCNTIGLYFKEQLEIIKQKHNLKIKEVRGRGLMLALEFMPHFDGKKISDLLFEDGNIIGFKLNTLRFLPPLTIKTTDIDSMIGKLDNLLTNQNKQTQNK